MADVRVTQPHALPPQDAKDRVQSFEDMIKKYGVKANWNGLSAQLKGPGVKGSIEVGTQAVEVNLSLGMLARAAGVDPQRLEGSIRRRLEAALTA